LRIGQINIMINRRLSSARTYKKLIGVETLLLSTFRSFVFRTKLAKQRILLFRQSET